MFTTIKINHKIDSRCLRIVLFRSVALGHYLKRTSIVWRAQRFTIADHTNLSGHNANRLGLRFVFRGLSQFVIEQKSLCGQVAGSENYHQSLLMLMHFSEIGRDEKNNGSYLGNVISNVMFD